VSNLNKHKPLNSDELFQLLGHQSDEGIDFEELDDFEKEALEGFSANVTIEKAKELTEELNRAISKKVSTQSAGGNNKIIWFSAAASIVLIIIISVFFFNQIKHSNDSNLALHQTSDKLGSTKILESQNSENTSKQEESPIEPKIENDKKIENLISQSSLKEATTSKNKNVYAANTDESTIEQKESELDIAVEPQLEKLSDVENDNVLTTISADNGRKLSKDDFIFIKKKSETVANVSNDNIPSKKSSAVPSVSAKRLADVSNQKTIEYYEGGETAIKKFVENYMKEHFNSFSITGKFKIKGTVNSIGSLKVVSVTQITKNYCEQCSEKLEKALNTMTNWKSATVVEFNLDF
jgi:hypothetical protein